MIQPLWRTVWRFLKKLQIELPHDPAIPLLGIYPEKTIIQKDMDVENKRTNTKGGREGGMNWENGIDIFTLICIK